MTKTLHITLAQLNPIVGDIDGNTEKLRGVWDDVPGDIDLIVFPETYLSGYPAEDLVLKPSFMDAIEAAAHKLAQESQNKNPWIILPTPWRLDGDLYNAALVIGDGRIQATVHKHHLPNYDVFDEQRVFKRGALPDPIGIKGHSIGLMLCEDMWSSDVAAHLQDGGAEILLVPNGSPYETHKISQRLGEAEARVKETGLPLIYLNMVGGQDELVFDGASFVMDAKGEVVVQTPEFEEAIIHTRWQNGVCQTEDITPALRETEAIYKACVLGLKDYVTKNGFPGVLLGLSGGIDSALVAAMAVDALGPEAVHCIMMPSPFTSEESLEDAKACVGSLGCRYDIISIEPAMTAFEEIFSRYSPSPAPLYPPSLSPMELSEKKLENSSLHGGEGGGKVTPDLIRGNKGGGCGGLLTGVAHENMQSRSRGLILMALSNASGEMVVSTGNKSEMAVGYATLYGDMCGGFNPLKDLYKTQVYELARWRNKESPVIPERILTKAPSAELKEGQTDQDSLPPYDALDDILEGLIEQDLSVSAIAARGHAPETVTKIWHMLERAEYKRRQAPPGVKITAKAFGRDRRYPITNKYTG